MSIGPVLVELWNEEVEKSSLENSKIGVTKKIMDMIFQLLPIITLQILEQLTCSLPKNVTTFHRQQDGIIHFCPSPNKRGILVLWIYIFTKKLMDFSKLDC